MHAALEHYVRAQEGRTAQLASHLRSATAVVSPAVATAPLTQGTVRVASVPQQRQNQQRQQALLPTLALLHERLQRHASTHSDLTTQVPAAAELQASHALEADTQRSLIVARVASLEHLSDVATEFSNQQHEGTEADATVDFSTLDAAGSHLPEPPAALQDNDCSDSDSDSDSENGGLDHEPAQFEF